MAVRVTSTVSQLYVRGEITYIMLDLPPEHGPKDNLYGLRLDLPNYNALFSLALAAAANRWPLTVRIIGPGDISSDKPAFVNYLVVNWSAGDN